MKINSVHKWMLIVSGTVFWLSVRLFLELTNRSFFRRQKQEIILELKTMNRMDRMIERKKEHGAFVVEV